MPVDGHLRLERLAEAVREPSDPIGLGTNSLGCPYDAARELNDRGSPVLLCASAVRCSVSNSIASAPPCSLAASSLLLPSFSSRPSHPVMRLLSVRATSSRVNSAPSCLSRAPRAGATLSSGRSSGTGTTKHETVLTSSVARLGVPKSATLNEPLSVALSEPPR